MRLNFLNISSALFSLEQWCVLSLCKKISFSFIFLFFSTYFKSYSQANDFFIRHGELSSVSCGGVSFIPVRNPNFQAHNTGSLLVKKPIDLNQPFETTFLVDYIDTLAVDGGAFVFQSDSGSLGENFYSLGYKGINRSIAVTFDAFKNDDQNDPIFDHISIQANGDIDHSSANNLAGPLSIENLYAFSFGVKTFHHLVSIKWDPSVKLLSVLIDNAPYISLQGDIVQKIFNNNSKVYWGFTGSNTQTKFYPASSELTLGYFRFSFGTVTPRFRSQPEVDTCFVKPVNFYDSSIYITENVVNSLQLFKWYWEFGDGTTSVLQNPPPHDYPGPGIYLFKFTATNQIGCTSDTLIKKIGLGSKPKVDFTTTATCTNAVVNFTDATINAVGVNARWMWDLDDNNTSNLQNPVATYTSAGFKKISLSVRTEYGCEADTLKMIEITDNPQIDFSFLQDCNATVQFTPSLANGATIDKWFWDFGDRNFSSLKDPLHKFQKNGIYQSSLFAVSANGCKSSVTKTVEIDKVDPFAGRDTIIAGGQPLKLNGSGGISYQWFPSIGLNNSLIPNPVAVLTSDQTYVLSVKNKEGCEAKDTINIKVYNGPEIYVPNAFTPNNDGLNDIFHITAAGFITCEIKIFNRTGEIMYQANNLENGWDGKFKGLEEPPGVYVWIINAVDYKGNSVKKKGIVTLIR